MTQPPSPVGPGSVVIAYLQAPRERFWGVIRSLDGTGVVIEGIDLNSFDDWLQGVAEGGDGPGLSIVFFPLPRLEKLLVDADSGAAPSLIQRFERRIGRRLHEFLETGKRG